MANEQTPTADYGFDDPDQLQQAASTQQAQMYEKGDTTARQFQMITNGIQGAFGNPVVNKARAVQERFKAILSQTNEDSPADEDPLDKQVRLAHAISIGMVDLSPQMATQAMGQLAQLQQAKLQRAHLTAETGKVEQEALSDQLKNKILQNSPATMVLAKDAGKDENGLPQGYNAVGSYDLKDDNTPAAMHAAIAEAAKNGDTLIPISPKELLDSKYQVAVARGQYQNQSALIAAMGKIQTANAKGAGAGDRFADRMMSSANAVAVDAENISHIPFGSNSGTFGGWVHPNSGLDLFAAPVNSLRNALTPQDVQSYNVLSQGMFRSLAMIELQGGLQGGASFAKSVQDQLALHPGDTPLTIMEKLAKVRQTVEAQMQNTLAKPNIPETQKEVLRGALASLEKSIPYTPADVIDFGNKGKNNQKLTFLDYAQQRKVGAATTQSGQVARTMPSGDKLTEYATQHFGGDKNAATAYLQSQGYK